ncbi:hypothetical protein C8J56DRAFT_932898 [Mycena floridula]|nr:hypothetical protein C8J56DRAFT_932898 [Mycena floridula]
MAGISSSDIRWIISCSMDHTAYAIDSEPGAVKLRGHENGAQVVAFVPVHAVATVRDLTSSKTILLRFPTPLPVLARRQSDYEMPCDFCRAHQLHPCYHISSR